MLLSLVAAALATVISRAVTGPLGKAVHAIQAVARGDLSVSTQATSKDEAGKMLAATTEMTAMLRRFSEQTQLMAQMQRDEPKIGRNDPCPCGSGKKYKHCHGQLS